MLEIVSVLPQSLTELTAHLMAGNTVEPQSVMTLVEDHISLLQVEQYFPLQELRKQLPQRPLVPRVSAIEGTRRLCLPLL